MSTHSRRQISFVSFISVHMNVYDKTGVLQGHLVTKRRNKSTQIPENPRVNFRRARFSWFVGLKLKSVRIAE